MFKVVISYNGRCKIAEWDGKVVEIGDGNNIAGIVSGSKLEKAIRDINRRIDTATKGREILNNDGLESYAQYREGNGVLFMDTDSIRQMGLEACKVYNDDIIDYQTGLLNTVNELADGQEISYKKLREDKLYTLGIIDRKCDTYLTIRSINDVSMHKAVLHKLIYDFSGVYDYFNKVKLSIGLQNEPSIILNVLNQSVLDKTGASNGLYHKFDIKKYGKEYGAIREITDKIYQLRGIGSEEPVNDVYRDYCRAVKGLKNDINEFIISQILEYFGAKAIGTMGLIGSKRVDVETFGDITEKQTIVNVKVGLNDVVLYNIPYRINRMG